jgi:hypothetical protein
MSDETVNEKQQPYVYLNCGHVQGHHDWGQDKDSKDRRCPMCLEVCIFNLVPEYGLLIKSNVEMVNCLATVLMKIILTRP